MPAGNLRGPSGGQSCRRRFSACHSETMRCTCSIQSASWRFSTRAAMWRMNWPRLCSDARAPPSAAPRAGGISAGKTSVARTRSSTTSARAPASRRCSCETRALQTATRSAGRCAARASWSPARCAPSPPPRSLETKRAISAAASAESVWGRASPTAARQRSRNAGCAKSAARSRSSQRPRPTMPSGEGRTASERSWKVATRVAGLWSSVRGCARSLETAPATATARCSAA
mmetsp:Transcript_21621/g.60700  ORF Transcript_21621/g.60700 Transcript_21621/m.60700 type:complete len:231 (-) Transcript_21621:930-1622(-)